MNITLERPFAATDKGKRKNNEDCIYPLSELASPGQRLFMVCDGVGGAEKGEVASALACDSIQTFFNTFLDENGPSEDFINKTVRYTESRFDEYVTRHPEAQGMATTLTLLYVGESDVTVAHIGDSRIYQFREGQTVFATEDHSYVQSLVRLGQITKEEATAHPKRNIITRALIGTPHQTCADVAVIRDIQDGDVFFLCTDGVIESFTDGELGSLFSSGLNMETVKNRIVEKCTEESRDNYSFYIIPVQKIQKNAGYKQFILSFFYSFA
jgi:protein phosphatase